MRKVPCSNLASYLCWNMHMGTAISHHRSTGHQEVGSCHTRGEAQGISCMPPPSVDKAAHSGGFEIQRRHHQKSKTEVSVAPQKDMCPPKLKRKKLLTLEISKVGGWIVWTNFINTNFSQNNEVYFIQLIIQIVFWDEIFPSCYIRLLGISKNKNMLL